MSSFGQNHGYGNLANGFSLTLSDMVRIRNKTTEGQALPYLVIEANGCLNRVDDRFTEFENKNDILKKYSTPGL